MIGKAPLPLRLCIKLRILAPIILPLLCVLTMGACSSTPPPAQPVKGTISVVFDQKQARLLLERGDAAMGSGDLDVAINSYENALINWPSDNETWEKLFGTFEKKGDTQGMNYSAFFGKRVIWANSMRPRIAAGAFENVGLMNAETPFQDTRIPEAAERLTTFFKQRQTSKDSREVSQLTKEETIFDNYLIYPAVVVSIGVTVYILMSKFTPSK